MDFLRNLPTQQPQQLTQLIQIQPGRVVSMANEPAGTLPNDSFGLRRRREYQ